MAWLTYTNTSSLKLLVLWIVIRYKRHAIEMQHSCVSKLVIVDSGSSFALEPNEANQGHCQKGGSHLH